MSTSSGRWLFFPVHTSGLLSSSIFVISPHSQQCHPLVSPDDAFHTAPVRLRRPLTSTAIGAHAVHCLFTRGGIGMRTNDEFWDTLATGSMCRSSLFNLTCIHRECISERRLKETSSGCTKRGRKCLSGEWRSGTNRGIGCVDAKRVAHSIRRDV